MARPPSAPPLEGVRVVDLSRVIAGPCAARVLAELGAEVVSIQGEEAPDWALSFHLVFNAGKRSVTLDAGDEEGRARLFMLLDRLAPDVLLHNYRHLDVARALGVGPEAMRGRYPGLTYVHVSAYGDEGRFHDRPGFEQVVQAVSGIQLAYGKGGRPKLLPSPVIDIGCGLLAAFAALLGVYERRRSGRGLLATAHLTSVAVLLQLRQIAALRGGDEAMGEVQAGVLSALGRSVCVAGPRRALAAWARALGEPDAADALAAIQRRLRLAPIERWRRALADAGLGAEIGLVPHGSLRRLAGSTPMVERRPYPGVGRPHVLVRSPLHLDGTPLAEIGPPPRRGEDTARALGGIGVEAHDGAGVVAYPPEQPLWRWLLSFVRWGYFAVRSGNL